MGIGQSPGGNHLNTLTFSQALAHYQSVRPRLPAANRPGACTRLDNLDALADRFDVFLLDAFGVLNIGESAIPGVPERIAGLQAAGKRVLVVSNAASLPHAMLAAKYGRLGYDFAADDVISSRKAILHALKDAPNHHWGLMAPQELGREDLDGLNVSFLGDDPALYAQVDAFLFLGSQGWSDHRQSLIETALIRQARPIWVGNPDIVAPRETSFSAEPGHYAHLLAERTAIEPLFFGKPFGNIYDLAFARVGEVDRSRVLMVGDSLHTDILGAQEVGIKSALIADFGFLAGQSVDDAIAASGIRPDFILTRP